MVPVSKTLFLAAALSLDPNLGCETYMNSALGAGCRS